MKTADANYVDRLIRDWRLDQQSERFQARARSVLTELRAESLLLLIDPRLEVKVLAEDDHSVWAYFPIYSRRYIARKAQTKPGTKLLLLFSAPVFEKQPPGKSEDHLRDHLGHSLLYLRKPGAKNECADAQREWREARRREAKQKTNTLTVEPLGALRAERLGPLRAVKVGNLHVPKTAKTQIVLVEHGEEPREQRNIKVEYSEEPKPKTKNKA